MNFEDYTKLAITRLHLNSQNDVARELSITTASMSNFNTGKAFPSEKTMMRLAELAGVEKEKALIDLSTWRAKNDAARFEVWQRISKMIGLQIIIMLFYNYFLYESSTGALAYIVYYVYLTIFFFLFYQYVNAFKLMLKSNLSTKKAL